MRVRVCMRVRMCVCWMALEAGVLEAGAKEHKRPERPPTTGTQATTTRAPEPEHQRTRTQYEKEN